MNKQLATLAEKYNLKEFANNMVVGTINGYQVVVSISMTNAAANYTMIYGNFNETHAEFQKFLESKKKDYKLRIATIDKDSDQKEGEKHLPIFLLHRTALE
jgi:hypothetical protein